MEREIDLKKISDGKLYTNKDMVKAGCGECQGCSDVGGWETRFFWIQWIFTG